MSVTCIDLRLVVDALCDDARTLMTLRLVSHKFKQLADTRLARNIAISTPFSFYVDDRIRLPQSYGVALVGPLPEPLASALATTRVVSIREAVGLEAMLVVAAWTPRVNTVRILRNACSLQIQHWPSHPSLVRQVVFFPLAIKNRPISHSRDALPPRNIPGVCTRITVVTHTRSILSPRLPHVPAIHFGEEAADPHAVYIFRRDNPNARPLGVLRSSLPDTPGTLDHLPFTMALQMPRVKYTFVDMHTLDPEVVGLDPGRDGKHRRIMPADELIRAISDMLRERVAWERSTLGSRNMSPGPRAQLGGDDFDASVRFITLDGYRSEAGDAFHLDTTD